MIIRGGENIYPTEVENFLHKHPDIEDIQVQIVLLDHHIPDSNNIVLGKKV